MGTDILLFVEKRIDDQWVWMDEKHPNPDFGLDGSEPRWEYEQIYSTRNCSVFSILADVRNKNHFGKVMFHTFFEPKGFPLDASEEVQEEYARYKEDDDSASWLTLKELEAFDWDNTWVSWTDYIDSEQYIQYKESGQWGFHHTFAAHKTTLVSNAEMERLIQLGDITPNIRTGVTRKPESYRNVAKEFIDTVFPKLRSLADRDNASVRIVFSFGH